MSVGELKDSHGEFRTYNLDIAAVNQRHEFQLNRVTNPDRGEMGLTKVEWLNRDKATETDFCFLPKYSHKLLVSVCQPGSTSQP